MCYVLDFNKVKLFGGKGETTPHTKTNEKKQEKKFALVDTQPQSVLNRNERITFSDLDTEGKWFLT